MIVVAREKDKERHDRDEKRRNSKYSRYDERLAVELQPVPASKKAEEDDFYDLRDRVIRIIEYSRIQPTIKQGACEGASEYLL